MGERERRGGRMNEKIPYFGFCNKTFPISFGKANISEEKRGVAKV